jgi:hypothetical protein
VVGLLLAALVGGGFAVRQFGTARRQSGRGTQG